MSILRQWKTMGIIGLSLVMALTAIMGLAPPALGDDGRPFIGYADEMIIDSKQVCDVILLTAPGTGHATPLGQFTRVGNVVIHTDGSAEGTAVFTAAGGDQLFAAVKGVPTNCLKDACGTYTFTGGTGRFSNASGGAYFVAEFTSNGIHVTFEGTIQY